MRIMVTNLVVDQLESSIGCGGWQPRLGTNSSGILDTVFDVSTRRWDTLCRLEKVIQKTINSMLSPYYRSAYNTGFELLLSTYLGPNRQLESFQFHLARLE